MAKIGTGRNAAKNEASNVEHATETPITPGGAIDYVTLYNEIDATKTIKTQNSSGVKSKQIREVIDGLFASGMTEVKVAVVEAMINKQYGLKRVDKNNDNTVQNASVRSAGEAGKQYIITKVGGAATFIRNPDYVEPKAA